MKLKTHFFTLLIIIFNSTFVFTQNLFSNGDFENYTTCPNNLGQVDRVIGVESCTVTPDYYNASCGFLTDNSSAEGAYCSMNAQANIPSGDAFIGFFGGMFNSTSYQFESFILTLDQQTVAGQDYEIDFEMFTVDRPSGPCYKKLVGDCMDFGFLFFNSSNPVSCPTNAFYPIATPPHPAPSASINCSAISVGSWGHQSLTYTADGVYDRVLVYFFPNANSGTAACSGKTGKFYMDDLCIKPVGGTCTPCDYNVNAGADINICQGETVTLEGSSNGVQSHTWTSSGDGTFDDNTILNAIYTPGPNDITAGSITLTLTSDVPAAPCTQVSDELVLTIAPNTVPVIDEIPPLCISSSNIMLSATPTGGTWSGTGIINSTSGEFSPSQAGSGTWEITYTTSACGSNDVTQIDVHQNYTLNAGVDTSICANQSFTCTATATGNPAINWTTSGDGSFDDPTVVNTTYTPGQNDIENGAVNLTISTNITENACPQVSDQVTLSIDPASAILLTVPSEICEDSDPIVLLSDTPDGTWSGTGITDSQQGLFDPEIAGPGSWTIEYTLTEGGPCSIQASALILVDTQKDTEFNYTDETYCLPGSNPTPIITGDHGGIFHIDNNGSINTTNGEISLKDTEPGTYVISYTFASGCSASATDTIEICGDYDLQIPNVFTPNNDHVNDFFQLHFTGVKEISCVIFNRWGNIVFSSDFHQLEFVSELIIWDGLTASNEKTTEGVYFYRIEATDFQGNIHNHEGFLTLVK